MFMIANICGKMWKRPNIGKVVAKKVVWNLTFFTNLIWSWPNPVAGYFLHIGPCLFLWCGSWWSSKSSGTRCWEGLSGRRSCSCRAGSWCTPPCPRALDTWRPSRLCGGKRWNQWSRERAWWNQNKFSLVRLLRHLGGDLDRDLLDPFQVRVQAPHCEVLLM